MLLLRKLNAYEPDERCERVFRAPKKQRSASRAERKLSGKGDRSRTVLLESEMAPKEQYEDVG